MPISPPRERLLVLLVATAYILFIVAARSAGRAGHAARRADYHGGHTHGHLLSSSSDHHVQYLEVQSTLSPHLKNRDAIFHRRLARRRLERLRPSYALIYPRILKLVHRFSPLFDFLNQSSSVWDSRKRLEQPSGFRVRLDMELNDAPLRVVLRKSGSRLTSLPSHETSPLKRGSTRHDDRAQMDSSNARGDSVLTLYRPSLK
ncbi:hypothetical protein RvY_01721 [Ramazzottius varieornatus]|uniref:Uncharacterized protein n=1 Tax=Ramazzottius varieornatus TaxID=947166 RepID=A0A1D1UHD3_RAMVA|nr:hypothetical protein RvY_01721 [Ramazzottius varieornatus]